MSLFTPGDFWSHSVLVISYPSTPRYIWIAVVAVLVVFALTLGKIGIDILSPAGDVMYFGGSILLTAAMLVFLFCVIQI